MADFRGSITIVTETGQTTQSHLVIWNARQSDAGNYTCKPSIFKSAKLRLFVLNGESSFIFDKIVLKKYFNLDSDIHISIHF